MNQTRLFLRLKLIWKRTAKVAEKLSKSLTLIKRWAVKYYWKDRAVAYDNSLIEEERKEKIKIRSKQLERQNEIGQLLLTKATEILENANVQRGTFYAAAQMAELGCKLINEAYDLSDGENKDSEITINIRRADSNI